MHASTPAEGHPLVRGLKAAAACCCTQSPRIALGPMPTIEDLRHKDTTYHSCEYSFKRPECSGRVSARVLHTCVAHADQPRCPIMRLALTYRVNSCCIRIHIWKGTRPPTECLHVVDVVLAHAPHHIVQALVNHASSTKHDAAGFENP